MSEVAVKTHLIVTDVHDEYEMRWIGKIMDTKPVIKNGKPVFVIVGGHGRTEMNTVDMARIEKIAKKMTYPRGRAAVTVDTARVLIKEVDGKETVMGVLTHRHIKTFAPMFDKVEYY